MAFRSRTTGHIRPACAQEPWAHRAGRHRLRCWIRRLVPPLLCSDVVGEGGMRSCARPTQRKEGWKLAHRWHWGPAWLTLQDLTGAATSPQVSTCSVAWAKVCKDGPSLKKLTPPRLIITRPPLCASLGCRVTVRLCGDVGRRLASGRLVVSGGKAERHGPTCARA